MIRTIIDGFFSLLYPTSCTGCDLRTEGPFICEVCSATLKVANTVTLDVDRSSQIANPIALWEFQEDAPIQKVMHQIKYGNRPWIGSQVGTLLGAEIRERAPPVAESADLVTAVPLHASRRFERGYNQSDWIARGVAEALGIPQATSVLHRRRATVSQTTLSREERWTNVSGVFSAKAATVEGRIILLVDDTLTTGATLVECGRALIEAGAVLVQPCAIATAPLRLAVELDETNPVIAA